MANGFHISRVVLRNYKSIQHCDVRLEPITFLVGPNGAGKSNFVEALRFLSFGLSNSLEQALENRSGFQSIAYRGNGRPSTISFEVFFDFGGETNGSYFAEIAADSDGPVVVAREECRVTSGGSSHGFRLEAGEVTSNQGLMPAAAEGKFYLVNASGLPAFEPVYRALSNIVVYNPVPDEIRGFKPERRYRNLDRTGSALAEIVFKLKSVNSERWERITDYLRRINASVLGVDAVSVDANFGLRFDIDRGQGFSEAFPAQNISDGTLRALAILVALFQENKQQTLSLIGLEEPEAGLHPAAAGVLFDSLMEGSQHTQTIVTSHSPDLLDRDDLPEECLKAVIMSGGRTLIGEVDGAGKAALQERLFTAGELMRMDQLRPEPELDISGSR